MAKIKHTKNELKAQKDALGRYERFLPMLQLKKQQLQAEIQMIDAEIEKRRAEEARVWAGLQSWQKLFSASEGIAELIGIDALETEDGNVAGVQIPVLKQLKLRLEAPDLFATPAWFDEGLQTVERLITLRVESEILAEQKRRIAAELRTTTQRVNLFEKVKIPECRENIRIIKIFLGDEQTAGVARAKIAKGRSTAAAQPAPALEVSA